MAVNNGIRREGVQEKDTSVLERGTVEARGQGTRGSSDVDKEISDFLRGEGGSSGLRAEIRAFFTVWTFITRLPAPTWVDHHPGYLMRGMAYFPLAGSIVGLFVSVWFDFAVDFLALPATVSAAISTGFSFWMTGCFHEDGLADSADGIGGGWSKSQILKIMSDTRLGTYGCATLVLYVVAKLELLSSLGNSRWAWMDCSGAGPALVVAHAAARWTAPYLLATNPYVDEGGPKHRFYGFMLRAKELVTLGRVSFASLYTVAVGVLCYGSGVWTWLLLAAVFLTAWLSGRYARYLLGGVLGDYLGATICVAELVAFTTILARASLEGIAMKVLEGRWDLRDLVTGDRGLWLIMESEGAVYRLALASLFLCLWCAAVGPPDVFQRELTSKKRGGTSVSAKGGEALALEGDFADMYEAMTEELDRKCKPVGSLGTLEDWCARLAALQKSPTPSIRSPVLIIFCADHGVAKSEARGGEGCSGFPQEVTRSILKGLNTGLTAAPVLAKANNVDLKVVDVGVSEGRGDPPSDAKAEVSFKLREGTRNCCRGHAMTSGEVFKLMEVGRTKVREALAQQHDLILLGEIGIGNTTISSLLLCALTGCDPKEACGVGATVGREISKKAIAKKVGIVRKALSSQSGGVRTGGPTALLARFGGAELCALVGSILEASEKSVPVLVDGYICTVAALIASHISPLCIRVLFFPDLVTSEPGHKIALTAIAKVAEASGLPLPPLPALTMGMRLGEGSAALVACGLLKSVCSITKMGTLEELLK